MIGKHQFIFFYSKNATFELTTKYVKNWTQKGPGEERLPSLTGDPSNGSLL